MTHFAKMYSSKNSKWIDMLMDFMRGTQAENVQLKKALTLLQNKVNVIEGQSIQVANNCRRVLKNLKI